MGRSPAVPVSATFGANGGSIGRSPDCTMVLDDPGKLVSKRHATLSPHAGGMLLTCVSAANPVYVDGTPLAQNGSVVLRGGESLMIGGFELVCESTGSVPAGATARSTPPVAAPGDLFADLLGSAPSGAGRPPAASRPPPDFDPFADLLEPPPPGPASGAASPAAASPIATPSARPPAALSGAPSSPFAPSGPVRDDPLAMFAPSTAAPGSPATSADDPLALFGAPSGQDPLGIGGAGPAPRASPPGPRPTGAPDDTLRDVGITPAVRPAESLDALFDLSSARDPLASGSPLMPDPAGDARRRDGAGDLLAGLERAPHAAAPVPVTDRSSALQGTFSLPTPTAPPPGAPRPALSQPAPPAADPDALVRSGAVLSWSPQPGAEPAARPLRDDEVRAIGSDTADRHRAQFEAPPSTTPTHFLDQVNAAQQRALLAREGARRTGAIPGAADAAPSADAGALASDPAYAELLHQFLIGLGFAELPRGMTPGARPRASLSPELMRRMGELLRVSVHGTVELLQARAMLKRELRTEVTLMAAGDNNPLKFSPDGAAALAHLLAPQTVRGFMEPAVAMRDAYDDLLAHQIGFVAGMRAALAGLIARFDPERLEERLTQRSMLDALLPMARKARLWELFSELFADISLEAQEDFDALFGRAFVEAYEAQIARIEGGAPPDGAPDAEGPGDSRHPGGDGGPVRPGGGR